MPTQNRRGGKHLAGSAGLTASLFVLASFALLVTTLTGCKPAVPPGSVTALAIAVDQGQLELTWTNPPESSLTGVLIVRKTGGFPSSTTDGTTVFDALGETFLDTGLANGTRYYYAVYAHDKKPNYAAAAQASGVPTVSAARPDVLDSTAGLATQIQGSALPPAAIATLLEDLALAEEDYRAGDDCGSAAKLHDFLDHVQTFRTGPDIPLAEDFYNQARMLRFDILTGIPVKAACLGAERVGLTADAAVGAEDLAHVMTTVEFGEPKVQSLIVQGGLLFTQVDIPGADALSGTPGAPAIPVFRRLIAAPPGAEVTFDVQTTEAESIFMNLCPAQEAAVDAPDPSTFADKPFYQNPDAYGTNAFSPQWGGFLTELGPARGLPMYLLEIPAGQYNPVTQELKLRKSVQVNVHFKGGTGFLPEDINNGFDRGSIAVASTAINRASAVSTLYPGTVTRILGEELLILTPTVFREEADRLAAWKRTKGIATNVAEVGAGTDFATADQIRALIKSHYDHNIIRPSYILLFADSDRIPTYQMGAPIAVGAATIGSDWPYAVMGVPETSTVPDFAVGRIPEKTNFEMAVVVDKIINYEQNPPVNPAFYGHAAIASQFQCCRDGVAAGTDQRAFIETSEFARGVLASHGKTVDRIYTETGTATPQRYFDGTALPAALSAASGFAWSGSTADITAAYNQGRFLFIHRDHGGPDQWVHPFFGLGEIDALINGALQPVVFSVNCASGLFDNEQMPGVMGTSAAEVYVAERMLRRFGGGAVGVLGDSRNSPTWANNALLRGYMDAIWPSAIPSFGSAASKRRLGDILNHGKAYMLTQIGVGPAGAMPSASEVTAELRLWHCYGDPTLEIWSSNPHTFILSSALSAIRTSLVLTLNYEVNGAMVTAFQANPNGGTMVLGRATVEGGHATMNLFRQPLAETPVQFSVEYENAIPIQISANVPVGGTSAR